MFLPIYKMNNRKLAWYRKFYGHIIAHLHIPISATFAVTHVWLKACEKDNFWFTSDEGNYLSRCVSEYPWLSLDSSKICTIRSSIWMQSENYEEKSNIFPRQLRLWMDRITISNSSFFFYLKETWRSIRKA